MVILNRTAICNQSYTSSSAQDIVLKCVTSIANKSVLANLIRRRCEFELKNAFLHICDNPAAVGIAKDAFAAAATIMTLAILWRKLYVERRPAMADLLSMRNTSLAALLLRDGTAIRQCVWNLSSNCICVHHFHRHNPTDVRSGVENHLTTSEP